MVLGVSVASVSWVEIWVPGKVGDVSGRAVDGELSGGTAVSVEPVPVG